MITLVWNKSFKKKLIKYAEKHPGIIKKIEHKLELFVKDPYNPELRNHKLSGRLEGLRAIVVSYDCRIIYECINADEALLVDIGNHDEVY